MILTAFISTRMFQHTAARRRLVFRYILVCLCLRRFNTQPPEGGWENCSTNRIPIYFVSTHSRPKAAGLKQEILDEIEGQFQHTAARRRLVLCIPSKVFVCGFQHTAARRRLALDSYKGNQRQLFQHTAARRRLARHSTRQPASSCFNTQPPEGGWRPYRNVLALPHGFNTQPPEGGWLERRKRFPACRCFNTQPPEGGWFPCHIR